MSTDDVLLGLGLVLVLAVGAQLLAARLRLPAIVVLLPAGFLAGIATTDVQPDHLLGQLYQPFVSLAVGVILFEAGLRLSFAQVSASIRMLVGRLVVVGVLVTWICVALASRALFDGLGQGVPLLIGAIVTVSGPTVVLPLLAYVRPRRKLRSLLTWEGVLVDPLGALLGVLVFHAVSSSGGTGGTWRPGSMLGSLAVGAAVGAAGALLLWVVLREVQRTAPRQAVPVVLALVAAALVGADLLRQDTGFVAATVMGVVLANQHEIDVSLTLEFQGTLVQLLIGVLFVLIAASVSPSDVSAVLPGALALVAVMAVVVRPLAVALATWGTQLSLRERAFLAWMAPRGIVAGATASAFGLSLVQEGVGGADRILPIVFVVIFGTVVLYGLTAAPVARLLGVASAARPVVLIVGGSPWARSLAEALQRAGVAVRLWIGRPEDRDAARAAGLEAGRGRMLDTIDRETELEDVTDALVLTASDDLNAVIAAQLRADLGHAHVFRAAPEPGGGDLELPPGELGVLGGEHVTFAEVSRRLMAGERLRDAIVGAGDVPAGAGSASSAPADDGRAGDVLLAVVTAAGDVHLATRGEPPPVHAGDTTIVLSR